MGFPQPMNVEMAGIYKNNNSPLENNMAPYTTLIQNGL